MGCTTITSPDSPAEPTEAQEADDSEAGEIASAQAATPPEGPGGDDSQDVGGYVGSGSESGSSESGEDDQDETHWIAVEVVYDDGDPVANEPVEFKLPDGSKRSGTTDDEGKVRIENLAQSGQVEVNLTRICKKEWKKA